MALDIMKLVVAGIDTYNAVDAIQKMRKDKDPNAISQIARITDVLLPVFAVFENAGKFAGVESEHLMKLKMGEICVRAANLPAALFDEVISHKSVDMNLKKAIKIVGRLGYRVAGCVRAAAECDGYNEKKFLEMSPEELEEAKRPIIEPEWDGEDVSYKVVGYRPVDLDECRRNLEASENVADIAALVQILLKITSLSSGLVFAKMADAIAIDHAINRRRQRGVRQIAQRRLQNPGWQQNPMLPPAGNLNAPNIPAVERVRLAALPVNQGRNGSTDQQPSLTESDLREIYSFQKHSTLLEELYDDDVFKGFKCQITGKPIRSVVEDPSGEGLYERQVVYSRLKKDPTFLSPITKKPLSVAALKGNPAIQAIIDSRLKFYEAEFWCYMDKHPEEKEKLQERAESLVVRAIEEVQSRA